MPRDYAEARQSDYYLDGQIWSKPASAVPTVLPTINPATWEGQDAPPREWRVDDWVPLRQATLLTGKGGVGKSLLTQMLFTCTALGLPFLGVRTRQCPSLYITCEDDTDELWRRQGAICASLRVPMRALDGKLFLAALSGEAGNAVASFDATGSLTPTARWQQIEATVEAHDIGFVGLDNASHMMGGDHNDLNQVAAFLNLLNGLALKSNGAVMLLHHPNKAGDDWLGSVAWENQVRSRLVMKPSDIEGDPDARSLHNPKANYAPMGGRIDFRWHDGAFVRERDLPQSASGEISAIIKCAHDNDVFLACLRERAKQRRAVSEKHSASYAPTVFATMPESKGIGKNRLIAAMDRLFRTRKIERAALWKGDDRKDVFGLRELAGDGVRETQKTAENRAVNTVRETARETRETASETAENSAGDAADTHTTPKGGTGTAIRAAAPSLTERANPTSVAADDRPHTGGRMILAPGEAGDDVDLSE